MKKAPHESLLKVWPDSSTVSSTRYYPEIKVLEVVFNNGKRYNYFEFPNTAWEELKKASSIGSHIAKVVRLKYKCVEVATSKN